MGVSGNLDMAVVVWGYWLPECAMPTPSQSEGRERAKMPIAVAIPVKQ